MIFGPGQPVFSSDFPVLTFYHLPLKIDEKHREEDNKLLLPVHIAAIGNAYDTSKFLHLETKYQKINDGDHPYDKLHPLHLVSLYGSIKSHPNSSDDPILLISAVLNDFEDPDILDASFTTPLHYACLAGNLAIVEHLIKCGADVNRQQKKSSMTPLHFACQSGNDQVVELLLVNKGDPSITDSYGNTTLHYAVRCMDNVEVIKAIINAVVGDKEEFICTKNYGGISAIVLAVEENRLKIADYLLKQHLVNHSDHAHETLLVHLAAQRGSPDMVNILVQNGLSIEERDSRGQTPLHFASEEGHLQLVRELLQAGADIEARDERGYTPLLAAVSRDQEKIVRELLPKCLMTALSYFGENMVL
uniref:ANK_REP_REGION domain-containing protein n=1 Tax=Panagrolaimus sp. JU765 TaxID=591449 RepID=A0AC34QCX5_9BILA